MGQGYIRKGRPMKWQDWYLTALMIIVIIAIGLLPIVFPSESYFQALRGWNS
jgi:hypothetical protein